jgi:hypothetical protein
MIPILIIVLLLMNFSIGFFGVIHTGILNSMAARNYAFETFRHRSNLTYFTTDSATNASKDNAYDIDQQRMHTTLSERTMNSSSQNTFATSRPIDFFEYSARQADEVGTKEDDHNKGTNTVIDGKRFQGTGVNPVWIKTAYGICLNTTCGG